MILVSKQRLKKIKDFFYGGFTIIRDISANNNKTSVYIGEITKYILWFWGQNERFSFTGECECLHHNQ